MKYILLLLFSFTLQAQSLLLLFNDEVDSTTTLPPAVWSIDPALQTPPLLTATDYAGSRIGMFLGGMETAQAGVAKGWAYDGVNDALSIPWVAPSIWTITATSSANPTLTLKGTDYVSIDWGDSTITTILLTSSDQNISHTYTKSMQRSVRFINSEKITKFQTTSNLDWSFNLNTLPSSVNYIYIVGSNTITGNVADFKTGVTNIYISGSNTITGNVEDFKAGLNNISISGSNTITGNVEDFKAGLNNISIIGYNTITGDVADFKAGLNSIYINGYNTITGDVADFKTGLNTIGIHGNNTISGNLADFKTGLNTIGITGLNTITGNVADFKTGLNTIYITGLNTITDYTSKTWWNNINYFRINPTTGYGLSSAEVDQLIIDLSTTTWGGTSKTLELKGSNAAPTSASASARTSLQEQGVTVNVN